MRTILSIVGVALCAAAPMAQAQGAVGLRDRDQASAEERGRAQHARRRPAAAAEAIDAFDPSLALDPKHGVSLHARGIAKQKSGRAADGKSDVDRAIALNPKIAELSAKAGIAP